MVWVPDLVFHFCLALDYGISESGSSRGDSAEFVPDETARLRVDLCNKIRQIAHGACTDAGQAGASPLQTTQQ
jgi:hypothetical protein